MSEATGMVWLVNRLRCMSVAEVGYRIQQAAIKGVAKRMRGRAAPPLPRARTFHVSGAPLLFDAEREQLLADADSICAGHVVLFANRRFDVGMPPVWNRDPDSGVVGPAIFAGDISISNREQVGDIKHVWELNRHLHLVSLAQAWAVTGDVAWLHALHHQLRSWLDQCPPLVGPAPARRLARIDPRPLQRDRAPPVAPFLGQQSPDRGTRRPVCRGFGVAVLEGVRRLAGTGAARARARSAGPVLARRREP
jgi:hypothetical protein